VYLPNADEVGSVVARGTNFGSRNVIQCRGDVDRTVVLNCGPKGGPEWFDTHAVRSDFDSSRCGGPRTDIP
jgi:hypothetical protein